MGSLVYLIVPVAVFAFIVSVWVWRQRRPTSMDASLREFRRGLDALKPDPEASARSSDDGERTTPGLRRRR
jgi:hypothetical protein